MILDVNVRLHAACGLTGSAARAWAVFVLATYALAVWAMARASRTFSLALGLGLTCVALESPDIVVAKAAAVGSVLALVAIRLQRRAPKQRED